MRIDRHQHVEMRREQRADHFLADCFAGLERDVLAHIAEIGCNQDDAARTAVILLVLIVPQLVLYALIGVFVSVQHSKRRFLLPSAAPIVENFVVVATVLAVGAAYGTGMEVSPSFGMLGSLLRSHDEEPPAAWQQSL